MANLVQVSDYIISRVKSEDNSSLSVLKHQKLLYYIQAWHLALKKVVLFDGEFQAWVHGPVQRDIFNQYRDTKDMYSELVLEDIQDKEGINNLTEVEKLHINSVLDVYMKYTPSQLEYMTHSELPWIKARGGAAPCDRCESVISEDDMQMYYSSRLS